MVLGARERKASHPSLVSHDVGLLIPELFYTALTHVNPCKGPGLLKSVSPVY